MLVHKRTMGALTAVWLPIVIEGMDGECVAYDVKLKLVPATFENTVHLGITPNEWWYVNDFDNITLARKIRLNYPDIEPVEDADGNLIDVIIKREKTKKVPINRYADDYMEGMRIKSSSAKYFYENVEKGCTVDFDGKIKIPEYPMPTLEAPKYKNTDDEKTDIVFSRLFGRQKNN